MRSTPPPTFSLVADSGTDLIGDMCTAVPLGTTIASNGACINSDQCHVYEFLLGCSAQVPPGAAATLRRRTAPATAAAAAASAGGWNRSSSSSSSSVSTTAAANRTTCGTSCKSPTPELVQLALPISSARHTQTPARTPSAPPSPDAIPRVLASHVSLTTTATATATATNIYTNTNTVTTGLLCPARKPQKPRPRCINCGVDETSVWRKDERNRPTCNACGLFRKQHGYDRPQSFPFR
ncbi:hypothetical protein HDU82_005798, partial [Entophlyctis luteolus]